MALHEAAELNINAPIPNDAKKALKEVEEMHVRWKGKCKAKEESVVCKVEEEEEALHKDKEPACSGGEKEVNNKAAHLFNDNASPACEVEEEMRPLIPAAKPTVKPVPMKQIEFHMMRAMLASSPSAHGSTCSMKIIIPVRCKVSRLIMDWTALTGCTAPTGGRAS